MGRERSPPGGVHIFTRNGWSRQLWRAAGPGPGDGGPAGARCLPDERETRNETKRNEMIALSELAHLPCCRVAGDPHPMCSENQLV
eukprot:4585961-Pyramimonas_sp.AAC.1